MSRTEVRTETATVVLEDDVHHSPVGVHLALLAVGWVIARVRADRPVEGGAA